MLMTTLCCCCSCSGGRYQGHKKTEKFLPVGAIITVVGELARLKNLSSAGMRYLIGPPSPHGSPYFITNKTITELHMSLAKRAGVYKVSKQLLLQMNTQTPYVMLYAAAPASHCFKCCECYM